MKVSELKEAIKDIDGDLEIFLKAADLECKPVKDVSVLPLNNGVFSYDGKEAMVIRADENYGMRSFNCNNGYTCILRQGNGLKFEVVTKYKGVVEQIVQCDTYADADLEMDKAITCAFQGKLHMFDQEATEGTSNAGTQNAS